MGNNLNLIASQSLEKCKTLVLKDFKKNRLRNSSNEILARGKVKPTSSPENMMKTYNSKPVKQNKSQ